MAKVRRSPLILAVYDKNLELRGTIGNPISVRCAVRHNVKGLATIEIPSDHHRLNDILEDGSRMVITMPELDDPHLTSGIIYNVRGQGPKLSGKVTFTVHDDFRLFHNTLGWQRPAADISLQGEGGVEYDTQTGPVETVVKYYLAANARDRLGRNVVIAPDLGRGPTITASLRMHPLYDRLFPVVDGAGIDNTGIGWTVRQIDGALVADCYEPTTVPRTLSEEAGVIRDWSFTKIGPDATRVVIAGQGEGALRSYRTIEDLDREAQFGDVIEVPRDARDEEDPTKLPARGQEVLDEAAPKAGLSITLSESGRFQYGRVKVGDLLTMAVGNGITVGPKPLQEVNFAWTFQEGFTKTPVVGEVQNDPSRKMMAKVLEIGRSLRRRDLER